jgi:hypothetical protein
MFFSRENHADDYLSVTAHCSIVVNAVGWAEYSLMISVTMIRKRFLTSLQVAMDGTLDFTLFLSFVIDYYESKHTLNICA